MGGTQIRKLKDRDGKLMIDSYLVDKMVQDYPWVRTVYEEGSRYIHLSDKHIFSALRAEEQEGHISMKISDTDAFVTDDMYIEAITTFYHCVDILHSYVMGYVDMKRKDYSPTVSTDQTFKTSD